MPGRGSATSTAADCVSPVTAIAAKLMSRVQRVDEAIGEMARRPLARLERRGDRLDHIPADQRIALNGEGRARLLRRPVAAAFCTFLPGPRPLGRSTVNTDDTDLPALAISVCRDQSVERFFRRSAFREQVEQ